MDLRNETDIERLRQVALLQDAELTRLLELLKAQSRELDRLKGGEALQEALKLLEAAREQANAATEPTAPPSGPKPARKPQKGHGPKAQPDLPRVTERFELDEPDRTCPSCGGALAVLAGMQETSEMIDVIEVQYRVVQVERLKYGCKCGGCVETAPGPERAVEGGRYSLRFAVKVASDKYCHHCPLTRQASMMAEAGLEVTSQALFDQCAALAKLLKPCYEAILKHILAKSVIGLDQTGWPNLEKKSSKKWQVWCLTAPGAVYHRICDDKSAATFTELLKGFEGTVVCDAAASHSAGAREGPNIKLAHCWAHVLRKFRDCLPDHPEAEGALQLIGELYAIDERATTREERAQLRKTESKLATEWLQAWLIRNRGPRSLALGAAIEYTLKIWDNLCRFVTNPDIWLDNNPTERGLRGACVGRRVHFGSKSRRGTEVAAILYTLVETAKLHNRDPAKYLLEAARAAKLNKDAVTLPWA